MVELFDWEIRWQGTAMETGYTVNVGTGTQYLALYCPAQPLAHLRDPDGVKGGLNHIGLCVADLAATKARAKEMGFTLHSHADYEPGHWFYFQRYYGTEFEIDTYKSISPTPFLRDVVGARLLQPKGYLI